MIVAKAIEHPAWIAGGALIVVILVYAVVWLVSPREKEGYAPYSPTKYPYWGWKGTKYDGLRCKNNNNTGCNTKWEGGKLVDLETPATTPKPAPAPAKSPAPAVSSDCKPTYVKGKYTILDCKEVPANQRTVKDWDCFVESYNGRQYRKCVKKSVATKYTDEGISSRYPYWGKKGTKFEGLRCSKSDGVTGCDTKWVGGKLKDVGSSAKPEKKGSSATLDVVRKYPHWGWGANKGLRCKFGNNKGCTTKWVNGRLVDLEKPGDVCPFAWQTKNAKGKCVGCPPDRPHWDGKTKTCVGGAPGAAVGTPGTSSVSAETKYADAGIYSKYPYWGKKGTKFEGLRCSKSDGVTGCDTKWVGGKLKDAKPTSSATLDVVRKYPYWGWGANNGLKCKFGNNTGCTTKWVNGRLVDLERPGDVCKFAWQTKDAKGKCVGCPPDKPHWDGKTCVAKSGATTVVALDCKDPKHWVNDQCLCKDTTMSDPPGGDTSKWCTVKKEDWCKGSKHWVGDQCLCKDTTMEDPPGGDWTKWCTVKKTDWCKDPKHWVGDQCRCKDTNMEDPPGGDWTKWCTVTRAKTPEWRFERCQQLGSDFYPCDESNLQTDKTSPTGNPRLRNLDLSQQCCRDSKYACGSDSFFGSLKSTFTDGIFRSSRVRNKSNKCHVDVYSPDDGREIGLNAGGGPLSLVQALPPNPFSLMGKSGAALAAKGASEILKTVVKVQGAEVAGLAGEALGVGGGDAVTDKIADIPVLGEMIADYKPYSNEIDPNDDGSWDNDARCVNTSEDGTCARYANADW